MKTRIFKTALIALMTLMMMSSMCATAAADLPATWDWRDVDGVNYVTPVKNQGACGSCYALTAVAAFESYILTHGGSEYDLSEQQAKECTGYGCSSGSDTGVFNLFAITGSVLEVDDPYYEYDTYCNQSTTPVFRVTGWKMLYYGDRDEIKQYIYDYGHASTRYAVYSHSSLLVGWRDDPGQWILKNTFGPNTGDQGFVYVLYGSDVTESCIKSITGYEPHDSSVETMTHAEKGGTYGVGYHPDNTAWGMSLLDVEAGDGITKIEFDTTGATSDVDIYIYDGYDGYSLGNLLYQSENNAYDTPGFYSIDIDISMIMSNNTEVAVVGKFTNIDTMPNLNGFCPIAIDLFGVNSGKTYASQTGAAGTWSQQNKDVSFRLRVTDNPTNITIATIRRDIVTIRGTGLGDDESRWNNVSIVRNGNHLELDIVSWDDSRVVVHCSPIENGDIVTISNLHGTDSIEASGDTSSPCEVYDVDTNGIIDYDELMAAMQDYIDGLISMETFFVVLECYEA
jgi:hypothetical protein